MNFTKEDFEDCLFNPMEKGDLIERHDKLRQLFGSFRTEINKQALSIAKPKKSDIPDEVEGFDKTLRYILMMYDKNTPLKREPSYKNRKIKAAISAGFTSDEDKLTDQFIIQVISGKNKAVNRMIVLFVRMFRSHLYTRIVALEEAYASALEATLDGRYDSKTTEQVTELGNTIEDLYGDLFHEKKDEVLIDEAMLVMEEERAGIKPEDFARSIAEGNYITPTYLN